VRQVDVEQLISRLGDRVRRLVRAWRDPEAAKCLLEDARAGAYNVDCSKGTLGRIEGVLELCPGRHVTFFEDDAWAGRGGGVDKVLGFGSKGQVGDEDIAAFGDEGFSEAKVYPLDFSSVLALEREVSGARF
jgi:hypothetical protein